MARAEIRQQWETRIAAFRASGEKATHWCKANQVNRRQLYNWLKRIEGTGVSGAPSKRTAWVHVEIAPELETNLPSSSFIISSDFSKRIMEMICRNTVNWS
ncbi:IS66 family insertion sequence element accessory protein TnpA [Gorillibacterium massiliense]|uniref:IS66 family insertion sequence element accessory protein TnpA n=1 Tax=Gorillibacterium massiliense TaxID=1280390 RepID=UPI000592517B|nr:hypothetical protein [Gorillibacterium massiliense]